VPNDSCSSLCSPEGTQATCLAAVPGVCEWNSEDAGINYAPIGWAPFPGTADWITDNDEPAFLTATPGGNPAFPDPYSTRGAQFASWLQSSGAAIPWPLSDPKRDVDYVIAPSVPFALATLNNYNFDAAVPATEGGPDSVIDFTFDTPLGEDASAQLGRVMYTDMHLTEATQNQVSAPFIKLDGGFAPIFNPSYTAFGGAHECNPPEAGLNTQERVAEFLFFDLGACTGTGLTAAVPSSVYYDQETYTLDMCMAPTAGGSLTTGCPNTCSAANSSVQWRDFDWTAIIPGETDGGVWADSGLGPSLTFSFQSAPTQAQLGAYSDGGVAFGATPVYVLSPSDTVSGSYSQDVSKLLGSTGSQTWIRISMTLTPDSTHALAPILTNYVQQFDCISSQ
jgi:hypothetical protein